MAVVADELLLVVKSNVTQAMAGLQAVETKSAGLGGALKTGARVGVKAIAGIGLAAGAVGVASAGMAMGFEKDMAQIAALVGVPEAELAILKDAALDMGGAFGVGADEAAAGLFFLKSAGLDTETAIDALEKSAMASAIGLGEMEDLANTATTAMTNFGDQGIDAAAAFDSIATAAKLAKADPAALGKIMNENSASAALVGMSYEDMSGTLALLTRKFGDANKAGTGMGGILRKLVKPSQMAKDMLGEIGVTAEEFQQMLADDLPGGLATLDAAFAESGVTQSEWLGKVFEDGEAIKAAAAVIGTSGEEIAEVYGGMANAQGALEEGWGIMEETASVKFAKMKEGLMSALIPIGTMILEVAVPAITTLVEWLTKGVEWFSNLLSGGGEMSEGLGGIFATLKELIAGVVEWWNENFDDIVATVQTMYENLKAIWEEVWSYLEPVVTDIADFLFDTFDDIRAFIDDNMETIKEVIRIVMGVIQRTWGRIWDAIKDKIKPLWDGIRRTIEGVINIIKGIIQTVMAVITGDWDRAWEGIKMIFEGIWNGILGFLETIWVAIQAAWDLGIAAIQSAWDLFWSTLGNGIQAAWDGVVGIIKGALNGIIDALEWAINSTIGLLNGAIKGYNKIPLAPDIPLIPTVTIPGLAQGGTTLTAGRVLVGENGPEMLDLPKGATVTPLTEERAAAGGGIVIENVNSYGADSLDVAREVGWELMKRGVTAA